jgi:hypothetical protein
LSLLEGKSFEVLETLDFRLAIVGKRNLKQMYEKGREKTKAEKSLSLSCHRDELSQARLRYLVHRTHLGVGKVEKGVITCVIPAGSGSGLGKTLFRTDSFSSSGRIFFFGQEID